LRLKLSGEDEKHLAKRPTSNAGAYQDYLRGRSFANRLDAASQHQALDQFRLAVRADPNYAQAFAEIASVYLTLGLFFEAPRDAMEDARANARQALAIDPDSVDAHIILGQVSLNFDWDRAAATRELSNSLGPMPQAIEINSCTAHLLETSGQAGEAERGLRRALVNDPLSVPLNTELGCGAYYRRAYDIAIRANRDALQLDAHNEVAYWGLGRAYGQKQMYREALAELAKAVPPTGGASTIILSEMGYAYAKSGRVADARATLATLSALSQHIFVDPYLVATVYAGLGDQATALDWLDKAYEVRSGFMISLGSEPKWDGLRADPRFHALVKRVGFE
jgi:tetratricopeptide (TPR) repeat protein